MKKQCCPKCKRAFWTRSIPAAAPSMLGLQAMSKYPLADHACLRCLNKWKEKKAAPAPKVKTYGERMVITPVAPDKPGKKGGKKRQAKD